MNAKKKALVSLALCAALIVVVFVSGVLDRQKTWTEMVWNGLFFTTDSSLDLNEGDDYGIVNGGPKLTLPPGEYRLKWMIEADGINSIEITTDNGVRAVPGRISTSPDLVTDEHVFTLEEVAENVQMRVHFESGTRISVIDMRLYSPMYKDHAITFAFLALALWLLYMLDLQKYLTAKRKGMLLLGGFAVLIASAPALKDTICLGHDSVFHLVRLCNLADGLAHGQLPVRIGGYTYNGYGAITSVFYPDVFMYIPAIMMNLGASLQYAVNVFFIIINAASAVSMYVAAKRMLNDEDAALCASILYTLSIYRISDVFSRYAFGEMTAMVFLPIFILGLWEVVFGDEHRWITLTLSASAIFMSHMLSTLICACTAMGVGVLFIVKIVREKRLLSIVKACAAAGLLCAFYLVPFVLYSLQGIGAQALARDVVNDAISPAQLFLLGSGELPVDPRDRSLSTFSLEIGFPLLLGTVLALYVMMTADKHDVQEKLVLFLASAGAMFAMAATTLFPWSYVRILTFELSDYLQFPWRMLMMTAALLCFAGGWGYVHFAGKDKEKAIVLVLALCAMAALPTITSETRNNNFIPFGETVSPNLPHLEYTIPGTRTEPTRDHNVITMGRVNLENYRKKSTNIVVQVDAQKNARLEFPIFGYDGYKVTLNGKEMPWYTGENNRLAVEFEQDTKGEIEIWFEGKPLWRAADAVSLLTAVMLVFVMRKRKQGVKR